jgi:hypothetical protein
MNGRHLSDSPGPFMEDLIRNLCLKLVESNADSEEFHTIAAELRAALSQHIETIRARMVDYPSDPRSRD